MLNQRWYVAQLKAGRERIAISALDDQGFESYYPQMQSARDRKGRWVDAPVPVFPSYLFLRSQPDAARWRAVNGTRGVVRLLGNGEPCSVKDADVAQLMERERSGQLCHPHRRQIRQGDTVEFKCGSFVGLVGVCQWTRRERIGVLLQMLGGDTVATSSRDWLKLAAA